jgi:phage tail-like protein
MPPPNRQDPLTNHAFVVEIDGLAEIGFNEVTGLAAQVDVIEYRVGSDGGTRKLPGRVRFANVTMKRGFTGSCELFDWWTSVLQGGVQRRSVSVTLLDETGVRAARYLLREAFPVKYEGPDLDADGNEVAIETIELAHEGLQLDCD